MFAPRSFHALQCDWLLAEGSPSLCARPCARPTGRSIKPIGRDPSQGGSPAHACRAASRPSSGMTATSCAVGGRPRQRFGLGAITRWRRPRLRGRGSCHIVSRTHSQIVFRHRSLVNRSLEESGPWRRRWRSSKRLGIFGASRGAHLDDSHQSVAGACTSPGPHFDRHEYAYS